MAVIDISKLSVDERLDLIGELWDSLSAEPDTVPLTDGQREMLDERLDRLDRDRKLGLPLGIPADEVLDRIRSRFK